MTKVVLLKTPEISVTEEKKGKQIAVKENNIITLKDFYQKNTLAIQNSSTPTIDSVPQQNIANDNNNNKPQEKEDTTILQTVNNNSSINSTVTNTVGVQNPSVAPIEETPIKEQESENNEETPITNIPLESNPLPVSEATNAEEMDPELKEIKESLDQVILDLNNYKKKIKKLEEEVNQNLEKSREVLKDTQAAAKIMSIQQERQRQINEEQNKSATLTQEQSQILEKAVP